MSVTVTNFLAVVAGIMSVYVVLALVTSHVSEWISALTNQRGHLLEKAIRAMLGDHAPNGQRTGDAKRLVDYLYDHPLIGTLGANDRLPSYIPPRTFTISLVSALEDFTATNQTGAPADPAGSPWHATQDAALAALQARIESLPDGCLKRSLVTLLRDGTSTYDTALARIDSWFDVQMDRISGAYKRWATMVQMLIALVLVVALNADTIRIALELIAGTASSTGLVSAAQSADTGVSQLVDSLSKAGLTIGWPTTPHTTGDWFVKISGLLVTWFAVLLGAPFWFDMLKQIVPVRMAGPKPVKSKAHAKGDAQAKVQP